jgi:hypothetical protein
MSVCAHHKQNQNQHDDITCFEYEDLLVIANAYNQYNQNQKYFKKINLLKKPTKESLWKSIHKRLSHYCEKETCWIEQDFIHKIQNPDLKSKLQHLVFKPKAPKGKYSWLSTKDINNIMYQYQRLYNDTFVFLGALPSDISRVAKINFSQIKRFKPYVGIVFNTDRYLKPGKHWVCVFINNTKKTIDYFDSVGKKPNKFIREFLDHFRDYNVCFNKTEHQKNNSNCGVYCCFFIIERLKGKSMDQINEKIISDKEMTQYRDILFRPHT